MSDKNLVKGLVDGPLLCTGQIEVLNPFGDLRSGPRFSDSPISVFYPFWLRADHAACGHSTLPM